MAKNINLDNQFAETQNIEVKSSRNMFRYRKKFKKGQVANGRKQSRFHDKTKNLTAGVRRD